MLETLLKILSFDEPFAPIIVREDDGDICLEWEGADTLISINASGGVNWVGKKGRHGTDIDEFQHILGTITGS